MRSIIKRAITKWVLWRTDRRLFRGYPHLRQRAEAIRAARKTPQETKLLLDEQQRDMLRLLRENM